MLSFVYLLSNTTTMKRKVLTAIEVKELCELYPNSYAQDLAKKFGCCVEVVYRTASYHGVKKSKEWMAMELQRQSTRLKESGKAHRYSKGRIPENKGKKMDNELYAKCYPTMFWKGHLPHNTQPIGSERFCKDGYVQVKYALHKWKGKHILIWEEHNGALKKGEMVKFKDGDKTNIVIENLYLSTRRNNMDSNTIHRYPVELKSTIRLVGKLKRTIEKKTK